MLKRFNLFSFIAFLWYCNVMPHRNVLRQFAADNVYHCYNRGVEKRQIFMDEQDYGVFLNRLKQALSDPDDIKDDQPTEHIKSYYGEIELMAYCLMPNHFHLLLYQYTDHAIAEFMRTLSTSYTMYFNERYDRVGSLFQGRYKARLVDTDVYWQHISRYIHLNPFNIDNDIEQFPYSSMQFYKSPEKCPSWLLPRRVLESYDSYQSYRHFVYQYANNDAYEKINMTYSFE